MPTPPQPRLPISKPSRQELGPEHRRSPLRRAETWLWTGPIGHFLGGGLDFLQALARYARARRAR